jgi:hypothetical protein
MSTDSDTRTGTDLITLEQVEHTLLHGGDIDVVSDEEIQTDMVRRILAAETMEEAFAQFTTVPLDAVVQAPVEVQGIAWMKSAFDEGPKVYALLKLRLLKAHTGAGKQGEVITVSMGGKTTMAAFVWAQRHAAMPFKGSFHREQSRSNAARSFIVFKLG